METNNATSLFEKAHSPYLQGGIVLTLVFVVMLLAKVIKWTGLLTLSDAYPWTVSVSFMLFFALFNSIFSLASKNIDYYWRQSIIAFLGLTLVSAGLAFVFSSVPLSEVGEYKWIFMVFAFGYLVFISIIGFMKRIVEFAQREEWSKPRRRSKP